MTEGWNTLRKPVRKPKGRPGPTPDEFRDAQRGRRIQKVLAEAGVGSRRACEEMIGEGLVAVNGHVITNLPAWVDPVEDRITVRGKMLTKPEQFIYIALCKPRNVVCTNDDPEGRQRAIDLVNHPSRARLFPVGRLDMDSTGLLLLTNDGELANRLTHPRHGIHKIYEVTVEGSLDAEAVRKLEAGLFLTKRSDGPGTRKVDASRTRGSRLRIIKRDRESTRLTMELREGRNRQIRRIMARLGHPVKRLRRVQMGPIGLRGLKSGHWRELLPQELKALREQAFGTKKRKKPRAAPKPTGED